MNELRTLSLVGYQIEKFLHIFSNPSIFSLKVKNYKSLKSYCSKI
jgi:hypothetical protein